MTRCCSFISSGSLGIVSFGISYVHVMYWLPVLLTVYFASWKNCDDYVASKLTIILCHDSKF